jgi:hypothetical protein
MDGDDLFRRVFENMRRPERAINACAQLLKLCGHAAIENVDTFEKP